MDSNAPNPFSPLRAPKWVEASLAVHYNLVDSQNRARCQDYTGRMKKQTLMQSVQCQTFHWGSDFRARVIINDIKHLPNGLLLKLHVSVMKVLPDQGVLRFDVKKRGDLQTRNTASKAINKSSTTYEMERFLAHEIKRKCVHMTSPTFWGSLVQVV